jgi:hypothetical protein
MTDHLHVGRDWHKNRAGFRAQRWKGGGGAEGTQSPDIVTVQSYFASWCAELCVQGIIQYFTLIGAKSMGGPPLWPGAWLLRGSPVNAPILLF